VNIDINALRSIEREKDIAFETVVDAIETALASAYRKVEGAQEHCRVEVHRTSGEVTVWAQEVDEEGTVLREFEDTPSDFGRIAAMTAKQVILQRLRDAEQEITFGEYAGREGDIVAGVIQQHESRNVLIQLGKVEAVLPPAEQVPGERYDHGLRIRAYVLQVHKGVRGPSITLSRTHPNLVKKLFELEVPEIADGPSRSWPSPARRATAARSPCGRRSAASTPRAPASGRSAARAQRDVRAARREDRHRGLVGRPRDVHRARAVAGERQPGRRGRRGDQVGAGRGPGLPAVAGDRQGGPERAARGPLTSWRIDIRSDAEPVGDDTPPAPTAAGGDVG
jgi:N utilization substance protein A